MFKFGIDWSEQHHNLSIRNDKGAIVSQVEFKHTLEGFQRFDDERRKLGVPPSQCLVAIETAYNLLVDFLLDRGYLVYLISPQATKGYRNRQRSTDAHTDDTDAALLSSILHTDLDSHRRLQPNSCQLSGYNVPPTFTNSVPGVFTNGVPGIFTNSVPSVFTQTVPL
jgi:transposase